MNIDVFNLENFNIISDGENYYFFRALNMGDNSDIENLITTDANGNIQRIRTDRERYEKTPKYNEDSTISLEEIFDHVKMHHRKDTNCISLSSNANVIAMYGRGYYKDRYVMVKVPKYKLGENVVNAGTYMMEEIQKRIDSFLQTDDISSLTKYFITAIDNAQNQEDLDRIINQYQETLTTIPSIGMFERGISFNYNSTTSLNYPSLNERQNFEKNKMIAKIDIIGKDIIPNVSNKFLIQTLGNAFSSLELTHYGDISNEEITEVSKEIMDIFSLLQQLPKDYPYADELKQEVLNYLNTNSESIPSFNYADSHLDTENDYVIERMYELTNGNVDFNSAIDLYKKSFYLAKSKLRASSMINLLNEITGNNPKYRETLSYLYDNSYGVEPEIFSRIASNKINVSESVAMDFSPREKELFNFIDGLSNQDLDYIINNTLNALNYYLNNFESIEKLNYDKETYYANAIFDLFDWKKLDIDSISIKQRNQLINKLKESNIVEIYEILKNNGVKENDIANVLLTTIIKEKDLNNLDFNDTFTVDELEDFLGYYQVKGTKQLKLRSYQASALHNIDESFKTHRFTSAILPTGAGKSFVALAEMLEHSDKEILYLAPNNEILNQIKDYIVENIHGLPRTYGVEQDELIKRVFPNLKLRTYNATTNFNQQEVIDHRYDLIIFDELHRSGAPDWKKHILMLLGNQDNNTRVLGITATPQRDADLMNMSDYWASYFGYTDEEIERHEHLSVNMDLLEAIKLGYVVNPKIVECEYNLQDEGGLDNLLERINQIDDEETKKRLILKFEDLRRQVSQAKGMSEVIGDNLKMGGKYIVFCPIVNRESRELEDEDGLEIDCKLSGDEVIEKYKQELLIQLKQYYGLNDEQIKKIVDFNSMLGSYSKSRNQRELKKFEQDDFSKIKFILVMNKLNEGVHVKDVDGIIWYRPLDENSKILFLQQLGRIISANDPNKELSEDKIPIAIDLVNNVLRVSMKKDDKFQMNDLDRLIIIMNWSKEHDDRIPNLNSSDRVEQQHGLVLKKLQNKYIEFLENPELISNYSTKEQNEIKKILELGKELDLWNYDFPDYMNKEQTRDISIPDFEDIFEIKGILKDYYELNSEVEELIGSLSFPEKLKEAYDYLQKKGKLPVYDDNTIKFSDGVLMGNWLRLNKKRLESMFEENEYAVAIVLELNSRKIVPAADKFDVRLKEAYEYLQKEGELPSLQDREILFSDGTSMGSWLNNNKKELIARMEENEYARAIITELERRKGLSLDDRIKEIYDFITSTDEDKGFIPNSYDNKIGFSDGYLMGKWIVHNKYKIYEKRDTNKYVNAIIEELEKNKRLDFDDKVKEAYDFITSSDEGKGFIPSNKNKEIRFSDGTLIGSWIHNKRNITKLQSMSATNEYARALLNELDERKKSKELDEKFDMRLKETHEYLQKEGELPKLNDGKIKFSDGVSMGPWLNTNKKEIVARMEENEYARAIINELERRKGLSFDEQIKETYEFLTMKGYLPMPTDDLIIKFSDRKIMNHWFGNNKFKIFNSALEGNELAQIFVSKLLEIKPNSFDSVIKTLKAKGEFDKISTFGQTVTRINKFEEKEKMKGEDNGRKV